jgi:hypothetical protein
MLVNKSVLRVAGASMAATISIASHAPRAQAASDADRIEKLERAVQALQQRNALRAKKDSEGVCRVPDFRR